MLTQPCFAVKKGLLVCQCKDLFSMDILCFATFFFLNFRRGYFLFSPFLQASSDCSWRCIRRTYPYSICQLTGGAITPTCAHTWLHHTTIGIYRDIWKGKRDGSTGVSHGPYQFLHQLHSIPYPTCESWNEISTFNDKKNSSLQFELSSWAMHFFYTGKEIKCGCLFS